MNSFASTGRHTHDHPQGAPEKPSRDAVSTDKSFNLGMQPVNNYTGELPALRSWDRHWKQVTPHTRQDKGLSHRPESGLANRRRSNNVRFVGIDGELANL